MEVEEFLVLLTQLLCLNVVLRKLRQNAHLQKKKNPF